MDMSIQLKAASGAICTLSLSFNNDGPLGTFFRYICDNGTYIARYDDLVDGKDKPIDVSKVDVSMNGIELQDREFFAAIREGREPNASVAAGAALLPHAASSWSKAAPGTGAVMKLTQPPFRADHVGSLLRPKELLRAREEHKHGRIGAAQLKAIEDDAIRAAVKMQEDIGLQGITDGEFRRSSWHMDFMYQIGGVQKVEQNITVHFHSDQGDVDFTPSGLRVASKLNLDGCIFGDHFEFLKSVVGQGTPKLTIPSPSMIHYRGGRAAIDMARVSAHGRVLARLERGVRPGDRRARQARLQVPAARRHESRVSQRSEAARVRAEHRRRSRRSASDLHPQHQRGARCAAGWACASARTCAAAISVRPGRRPAATTMSPKRCSTS